MKKLFTIIILLVFCFYLQSSSEGVGEVDLSKIEQFQLEKNDQIEAALAAADAVKKAGAYIEALSDLFTNQQLTLPVGIKKGDYELIVQEIINDKQTGKSMIRATCAFKFKDTGQKIAFEGLVELRGVNGLGTSGKLALIAPVQRKMGAHSTIIVREGTSVSFDCEGIDLFDAKLIWMLTSNKIIPTDNKGVPVNKPLAVAFDAVFHNFDSYMVSLNINQSFSIKGLNDVVFTLKGATLDQSDTETSTLTKFPPQYFSQQGEEQTKLWKGVAVSEATVMLPKAFSKAGSTERITLSLQQVLFDENGFTCNVTAKNIIQSETIDKTQWDISLTDVLLGIVKNNVVSFGLGGDMNIPPFGKNSLFPYTAVFNPVTEEIEIIAGLAGAYDLPALSSTITLNELSKIDVVFNDTGVYPSIYATGKLTVNAPLGADSTKTFSVPDIAFENMVISRESPYLEIGAIGISGELRTPSLAGFELSISNIHTFINDKGSGLGFQAGISLNETFSGSAGLQLYGDYNKWKFNKVGVDKVNIDYKSKAFSVAGGVWFKNDDPIFGDGFRGDVTLSLIEKFTLDAVGIFGKVDNYRYFLADTFLELPLESGILVPPGLSFYGFGGGLYRRMQQSSKLPTQNASASDLEFGQSLSGISYFPDKTVGMGFMATTKFSLQATPDAFNAKVGFEMQFNNSGGLNFVQFRGDASFMNAADKWGALSDNIMDGMKEMEAAGKIQPTKAAKEELNKVPKNKADGFLTAGINIEYDFINSTFSADLNAYLNAGIIRGVGANDCMGWASAYFSPQKWYTYMGTPTNPLGIKIIELAEAKSYFMLGNDIPGLPLPPQKVLNVLSADKQAQLARGAGDMSLGKGIAFGSALDVNFDATLRPFYARMAVGLGTEFLLKSLNGQTCANYPGVPGINGWYAEAQAWAYVQAAIGMEANIFKKTRKFNILDITTGALLQGAGPNPMYFAGAVGGRFSVLGGLVSGNCNFDFEIGEKCIREGGSPFGEAIIAQLTPNTNAKDVNVFTAPQAIFNVPIEVAMTIDEEDTKGTYKVTLEEFTIKYKDGRTLTGRNTISSDGTVCMFKPSEPFESKKDMEVYAKVGFKKKQGNNWVYVNGDDGKPVFEDMKTAFVTGDRPKEIAPEHVKYSYPMSRQYNFYADEYNQGYILVSENYNYLFTTHKPEGFNQVLRFTDSNGKKHETAFTSNPNTSTNDILLEIDFSLAQIPFAKEEIYKLAIVNVPQKSNASIKSNITETETALEGIDDISVTRQEATEAITQLDEKEIYALYFRTSKYGTFAEKAKAFDKKSEGARGWVESYVHRLVTNLRGNELFDAYETQNANKEQQAVRLTAILDQTDWYNNTFYKDMYQSLTQRKPATDKIEVSVGTNNRLLTDDEINTGSGSGFNIVGTFFYNIPYWCAHDFYATKEDIAKRAIRGQITQEETALLNTNFPPVVHKGNYPVKASYVLPGRDITTSNVNINMYNPVTP